MKTFTLLFSLSLFCFAFAQFFEPRKHSTVIAGSTIPVSWNSSNAVSEFVNVTLGTVVSSTKYSTGEEYIPLDVIGPRLENTGSANWTVSTGLNSGDNYALKLYFESTGFYIFSDVFTIETAAQYKSGVTITAAPTQPTSVNSLSQPLPTVPIEVESRIAQTVAQMILQLKSSYSEVAAQYTTVTNPF